MGSNSCCPSATGNATGARAGSLTRVALFDGADNNIDRGDDDDNDKDVADDDLTETLLDFVRGKGILVVDISTCRHYWLTEPWSFILLCDPDEAAGLKALESVILKSDAFPQEPLLHHHLTWKWLGPGHHRSELEL